MFPRSAISPTFGTFKVPDEDTLARLQQLEADNLCLENELTRQKEETDEVRRIFLEKSDQVSTAATRPLLLSFVMKFSVNNWFVWNQCFSCCQCKI